ncbi:hypothetical protein HD599_002126 [Conyzicola lurida]|uniref:Uncharacterized protein n=1 Tax=Conyzicola lurida TaxID=1172621 RepID=A0A841AQD4_9MICO|nr:hypothetical protein [Conyzicola lurida]MBB5843803.1 hypothetical protein [Conyzicola lurida]
MEFVWIFLTLAFTGMFAASAFSTGKVFAAKSRLDLVFGGLDAVVVLAVAREVAPWGTVSPLLWLLPVAIVAVGTAGSVFAWPMLAALREDRPGWRTLVFGAVHLAVLVTITVVVYAL